MIQMYLIELEGSEPRWLLAPDDLPAVITLEDLQNWRYGKLLTAKLGEVVAVYRQVAPGEWLRPRPSLVSA